MSSALRLSRDLDALDATISRVLQRAARSGVLASSAGSPMGDKLDALAACQLQLRDGRREGEGRVAARPPCDPPITRTGARKEA